jgi:hypothetical protein
MLKNFLDYVRFSGIWVSFALNPCHWRLSGSFHKPTDTDPSMYAIYITVGPLSVRTVLDNGTW